MTQRKCPKQRKSDLYRCTATGLRLAESYLEIEKAKRQDIEQEVLNLLSQGKYSDAVLAVAKYEATQVFPRGLGIVWKNYAKSSEFESLKTIFNSTPAILKPIEDHRLKQLRLAAGMMELWGTNTAGHWLPDGFDTGIHLDGDAACRTFIFYTIHMKNMKDYKALGAKMVEISGINDNTTCSECQKISGKKYLLENMPELPLAKCTSEMGCRCTSVVREWR